MGCLYQPWPYSEQCLTKMQCRKSTIATYPYGTSVCPTKPSGCRQLRAVKYQFVGNNVERANQPTRQQYSNETETLTCWWVTFLCALLYVLRKILKINLHTIDHVPSSPFSSKTIGLITYGSLNCCIPPLVCQLYSPPSCRGIQN